MKLLIFIPAFNEEKTIREVINSLPKVDGFDEQTVLVVDDGSSDRTLEEIAKTSAIVVSHKLNRGVGGAFQTGIAKGIELKADVLVNIDADGQFETQDILKLIKPIIDKKADFVTGNRFTKGRPENMSPMKYAGNWLVTSIINYLIKQKFTDVSCGFRAYSKEALLNLNILGQFTYTQEAFIDLSMKGLSIEEVPIEVKYFKGRKSRVFKGVLNYAMNSLLIIFKTIRDYKPLKFFGYTGLLLFLVGVVLETVLLIRYFIISSFSPYIFVGFIGGFLNIFGLVIIVIGIVADMMDRVRMTQEKILYLEKKKSYE